MFLMIGGTSLAVSLRGQAPLAFDVVSVKRTPPGTRGGGFQTPPGQFITRNYAVRALIVLAYGIAGFQIGELPAWTNDERYDIVAKMPVGTFTPQQRALMIRALLTDRFKLKTHEEVREIPIYALIWAKSDKKLGPSLRPTTLNCVAVLAERSGRGPTTPEEMMQCNFLTGALPGGAQRLRAQGISLTELAAAMGRFVDHPIFDRTSVAGGFDVDLTFMPQVGGPILCWSGDVSEFGAGAVVAGSA